MSADTLKKEVLKVDVERLRCLAMNEEYDNCFECQEREDIIAIFHKTPEQCFSRSYDFWFLMVSDEMVYEKVIETWGENYFNLYFSTSPYSTAELKEKVETAMTRIRNGEEIS